MAEVLFDDDDDDDEIFWIEDTYDEADDLAQHTIHSPVLINDDLALENNNDWSDWNDYSTDFYDSDEPERKRRRVNKANKGEEATHRKPKRRKEESIGNLPDLSLGDPYSSDGDIQLHSRPTVVWKSGVVPPKSPVLQHGQAEKVSILKDWRDRFKLPPPSKDTRGAQTSGHQRAIAVVIQQTPAPSNGDKDNGVNPVISASTRRHLQKVALPSDPDSTDSVEKLGEKPMDRRFKRNSREHSRSVELPPEPALANGVTPAKPKRKRRLDDEDKEADSPRKTRARRQSHDPVEADMRRPDEANNRDGNGIPASAGTVTGSMTGRTRKRKQSPADDEDLASHPDPKRAKLKPPEKEVAKSRSRPQATPVSRRSTRQQK
ncbi:MAG: hypothetical protein Q9216_002847 [Gyalolechia sp. 2 TL-2023]